MTLEKGSLVLIDYTAKVKDTNEIFETTLNEEAKNLASYDPAGRYEPRLVSIGEGWVIKGLDEVLSNSNPGDKIDIDILPEKGFGPRDPSKVRMIPQRKLGEKADELRAGDVVDIDDRKAIIRFIGSGRVQIDFNHRFAGKTLNYKVNILKMLTDDREKIISLMKRRLPINSDKVKIVMDENSLFITLPDDQTLIDGIQIIKKAIANDIFKYLPSIKNLQIIEEYSRPEPKAQEPKAQEPKAQEPKAQEPKAQEPKA